MSFYFLEFTIVMSLAHLKIDERDCNPLLILKLATGLGFSLKSLSLMQVASYGQCEKIDPLYP